MPGGGGRSVVVTFHPGWESERPGGRGGFFASDSRVRTLLHVLLSYPEVRYIVPNRISLDAGVGPSLLETIAHFLDRQHWLVKRVVIG